MKGRKQMKSLISAVLFLFTLDANATVLSVNVDPQVNIGETVTVEVQVTDVVNLYGIILDLVYDPSILLATSITPGDFPIPNFILTQDINPPDINYAATSLAPSPPRSGTGLVFSATFQAIAAGTSTFQFDNVILSDPNATPISVTLSDGAITVIPVPAAFWLFGTGFIGLIGFAGRNKA